MFFGRPAVFKLPPNCAGNTILKAGCGNGGLLGRTLSQAGGLRPIKKYG